MKHIRSAPYHPSSNGAAERFVQTFKRAMKMSDFPSLPFEQQLMNFLLIYRSTPHATTNVAPCTLFLNRSLKTRMDLLRPDIGSTVSSKQALQKLHHDRHSLSRDLYVGQRVMVRNMRPGPQYASWSTMDIWHCY